MKRKGYVTRTTAGMLFAAMLAMAAACSRSVAAEGEGEILVSTSDSSLTVGSVVARIPVGLDPADSLELFNKIVYEWIEGQVLADMAREKLPSVDEIDRRTEAFRNRLTVAEYLRQMSLGKNFKANPDSIVSFYEERRAEMVAETPIVKGLFLKVPSGAPGIDEIRRCVFSATPSSLDELDKKWIGEALQSDWFLTEWVDWESLADKIPYRFSDPDGFLEANTDFETENNGTVYLLHISDWIPSGQELPYEFAAPRIAAMYERANLVSYEQALVKALVKKALADGKLTAGNFDPVNGRRLKTVRKTAEADKTNENKLNDEK